MTKDISIWLSLGLGIFLGILIIVLLSGCMPSQEETTKYLEKASKFEAASGVKRVECNPFPTASIVCSGTLEGRAVSYTCDDLSCRWYDGH